MEWANNLREKRDGKALKALAEGADFVEFAVSGKGELNSILPAINKGVIAFHDSEIPSDGTIEFIMDFCKQHPGFIPCHYPHIVIPANDARYKSTVDKQHRLDTYYNAALAHIPQGEWLIKIDMDQIYDPVRLAHSFRLPFYDHDIVEYGRMNLHYADGNLFVHRENPLIESGDQWLIKNHNIKFTFFSDYNEKTQRFDAWEQLHIPWKKRFIKTELLIWHFPAMKNWRKTNTDWIMERWQPFGEWIPQARNSPYYKKKTGG